MIINILFAGVLAFSAGSGDMGKLPDLKQVGDEFDRLTQKKQFAASAQLLASTNEALRSPMVKLYEAIAWADAGRADDAAKALEQAFDYGLCNPQVVTKYPGLASLKSSSAWPRIEQRLRHLQERISDVDGFEVHTEDAVGFWKAYEQASADQSRAKEHFTAFILNGSPALRDYYANRYVSVDNLVQTTLVDHPRYYKYLRDRFRPDQLESIRERTIANMKRFRSHYPQAIFPHGYLMIGILNSAGSVTDLGVFIGLDMYGRGEGMPAGELSGGQKNAIGEASGIPGTLTHELMHFQQNYRDPMGGGVLLRKVIEEGVCDFLTELSSTNASSEGKRQRYFREHEAQILKEFKNEMEGTDLSKWMYNGSAGERPADLGYTLGYFISKSYYELATNKKQAVYELLNTESFLQLLKNSKYRDLR